MIEFLNRLFGRQTSGATAKERLRLVLMSDHLSLAPEMIEAMKRDLVDVISRYVEVDRDRIDVHFENQDKVLAMLANIPITGVNRNAGAPAHGVAANGSTTNGAAANGEQRPSQQSLQAGLARETAAQPGSGETSPVAPAVKKPTSTGTRKRRKKTTSATASEQSPEVTIPGP